jgi:Spy/CpxP family protein refolding chaperone
LPLKKVGERNVAMKKLAVILGIVMVATTSAFPAYAMGHGMGGGMGGGSGVTGNFGSRLFEWFQKWQNGSGYTNPRGEQEKQMERLDQQHYEDSAYLKYQIQMKEKELDALLKSTDPDLEKVRALRRNIRELRAEADKEQRNYQAEAGELNRIYRPDNGDAWSSYGSAGRSGSGGMGRGGGMGGYGP